MQQKRSISFESVTQRTRFVGRCRPVLSLSDGFRTGMLSTSLKPFIDHNDYLLASPGKLCQILAEDDFQIVGANLIGQNAPLGAVMRQTVAFEHQVQRLDQVCTAQLIPVGCAHNLLKKVAFFKPFSTLRKP